MLLLNIFIIFIYLTQLCYCTREVADTEEEPIIETDDYDEDESIQKYDSSIIKRSHKNPHHKKDKQITPDSDTKKSNNKHHHDHDNKHNNTKSKVLKKDEKHHHNNNNKHGRASHKGRPNYKHKNTQNHSSETVVTHKDHKTV